MKKFTFLKMTALMILMFSAFGVFGQTNIFAVAGGGTLPTGWTETNNVTAQAIDKTTYYLIEAGSPSDIITTSSYDLSSYTTLTINVSVATYGSGTTNPLQIEYSTSGGSTWETTSYTSSTPSSSTYIAGGPITINGIFTTATQFRFTNPGTSGRGVRIQNLTLDASSSTTPTITVTESSIPAMTAEIGSTPDTETINVSGTNLTEDISLAVSGTDATQFSVSTSSIAQSGGTAPSTLVTVTYTPSVAAATHTATLTLSSAGATNVLFTLNGETTEPISVSGDGTSGNPYTVADVFALNNSETGPYWVTGYIVGVPTSGGSGSLTSVQTTAPFTSNSAIALAASASETDPVNMIPIQLPSSSIRDGLNLQDNPSHLGKGVKVLGDLIAYFTAPGVKNTSDYVLDPSTGIFDKNLNIDNIFVSDGKIRLNAIAGETIDVFNVAGQRTVSRLATEGLNTVEIGSKGILIVKVGNRVSKVIVN
ncbi:MAG: DUF6359 domain-containing protein [Paludibacteraceae bacterium]